MLASPASASVIPTSFGSTFLLNEKVWLRVKSAPLGSLPATDDVDPVVARGDVAGVDPLNAALLERLELLEAVDVPRDRRAIDLHRHGVEPERLALLHRHEHRHLRVGGVEQPLLELVQLRGDPEHVRLDLLDLLVQALHLLLRDLFRATGNAADRAEQREGKRPAAPVPRARAADTNRPPPHGLSSAFDSPGSFGPPGCRACDRGHSCDLVAFGRPPN